MHVKAGVQTLLTPDELAALRETHRIQLARIAELERANQTLAAQADAIGRENIRLRERVEQLEHRLAPRAAPTLVVQAGSSEVASFCRGCGKRIGYMGGCDCAGDR